MFTDGRRPQNQPNAIQQGLPPIQPIQPLQHVRQGGLNQQRSPNSPHQPQYHHPQSATQGPYLSPHSSTQSLPPQQYQSPYIGSVHGDTNFFGAHPSPYSTNSIPGSYASSEPGESMATQTTMSRPHYPPMASYQTPQSNSPASVHSPHTDAHGRPLYSMPPMQQSGYYQPTYQMHQPHYGYSHPPTSHHPSISSAPPPLMSYPPAHQHPQQPQHDPIRQQQSMGDQKPSPASLQRQPPVLPQTPATAFTPSATISQSASSSSPNSNAAPGPIPATTPLVIQQDPNGTQWIQFEYSRDRVKMTYKIRCDVESVNTEELPPEFKTANCVYPRACVNREQYKGNRLSYETECNQVGWALAQLNPLLREKRGLIQRAVDSWRNSNQDVKLRSRRVRRMAKMGVRKSNQRTDVGGGPPSGPPGPASAGPQNPQVGPEYGAAPTHHHQAPSARPSDEIPTPSLVTLRYAQNFEPLRPQQSEGGAAVMPSIRDSMDQVPSNAHTLMKRKVDEMDYEEESEQSRSHKLFGDVPSAKRRKFILVDDPERGGARIRVRVTLDQVKMDDMPDSHLKHNAVYPRSYFPRQTASPGALSRARAAWDDEDDETEGASGTLPTRGRTMVKVPLMDGSETELAVPRMTKSRRTKEIALNEIGCRMSWDQARQFNGRTLFLQRSLDLFRNKMRQIMVSQGENASAVAPHFETRPGKRVWSEWQRDKRGRRVETPPKREQSP